MNTQVIGPRLLAQALGCIGLVALAAGLLVLAVGFQIDQYRPRVSRWLDSIRIRIRIRAARPVWRVSPRARVLTFDRTPRRRTVPAIWQEGGR